MLIFLTYIHIHEYLSTIQDLNPLVDIVAIGLAANTAHQYVLLCFGDTALFVSISTAYITFVKFLSCANSFVALESKRYVKTNC